MQAEEVFRIDLSASLVFSEHCLESGSVIGIFGAVGMSDCEYSCYSVFFVEFEDKVGVNCGYTRCLWRWWKA